MKTMNRIAVGTLACLVSLVALSASALTDAGNYNFTGDINFDGPVKIENTLLTNTAARLNSATIPSQTQPAATVGTSTVQTNSTVGGFETVTLWETVAGNRVLVGDTTNNTRIATGSWTNGGTITFAVPFGATPAVFLTYTTAPGTNEAVVATVDRTNFTTIGVTSEGKYIAVGTK